MTQMHTDSLNKESVLIRENLWLSLRFDFDLGFYRICNETLLVRAMMHLIEFFRSRFLFP